MGCYRQCLCY